MQHLGHSYSAPTPERAASSGSELLQAKNPNPLFRPHAPLLPRYPDVFITILAPPAPPTYRLHQLRTAVFLFLICTSQHYYHGLPATPPPTPLTEGEGTRSAKKASFSFFDMCGALRKAILGAPLRGTPSRSRTTTSYLEEEEVYLVTALVPSETACLASSPGRRSRTAVWTSREEMVLRLL